MYVYRCVTDENVLYGFKKGKYYIQGKHCLMYNRYLTGYYFYAPWKYGFKETNNIFIKIYTVLCYIFEKY